MPQSDKPASDFAPNAFAIRTTDSEGRSYNSFQWPREVGAVVTCPDWSDHAKCGNGLHGIADGLGNYALLSDTRDPLWWVVSFDRAEAVELDGKVKFPRCRVEYVGAMAGAMSMISQYSIKRILAEAKGNRATGDRRHAAATGDRGHAAATGYSGHAAATGKHSIAASLGYAGKAKAGASGAIVLATWNDDGELVAVRAAMVGQDGIEPDVWYSLGLDGQFERAE